MTKIKKSHLVKLTRMIVKEVKSQLNETSNTADLKRLKNLVKDIEKYESKSDDKSRIIANGLWKALYNFKDSLAYNKAIIQVEKDMDKK